MTTLDYIHRLVIPAAYDLLPLHMASVEATAMMLAIGLQESDQFRARRQYASGPARGFWQFERGGGVAGVLFHAKTGPIITALCEQTFQYPPTPRDCHTAIEHNDVLAACFARLLIWTLPTPLPTKLEESFGYAQYLAAWRPGKPHQDKWAGNYQTAWRQVMT